MRVLLFCIIVLFSSVDLNATSTPKDNAPIIADENDDDFFGDEFGDELSDEVFDPLSGYNRVMTSFNDYFFIYVLNPVAKAYDAVMPDFLQVGISNILKNLLFPVRLVNNLLQVKIVNSMEETGRFFINSTFGILGFFDAAKYIDMQAHDEDFGQTLGYYGIGSGFHVVLPFLGPSNVRDIFGRIGDIYTDPVTSYVKFRDNYNIPTNQDKAFALRSWETINLTSLHIGEYENIKKDAFDLYQFLRDIYEQKRNKAIKN